MKLSPNRLSGLICSVARLSLAVTAAGMILIQVPVGVSAQGTIPPPPAPPTFPTPPPSDPPAPTAAPPIATPAPARPPALRRTPASVRPLTTAQATPSPPPPPAVEAVPPPAPPTPTASPAPAIAGPPPAHPGDTNRDLPLWLIIALSISGMVGLASLGAYLNNRYRGEPPAFAEQAG